MDTLGGAKQARSVCFNFLDTFPHAERNTANKG
jgi:hypothetical protein